MQKFLLVLMTIGEGLIFFTGSSIIFCGLGIVFSSLLNTPVGGYLALGGCAFSCLFTLVVLIKAMSGGRRFIEAFDCEEEQKQEPAGITYGQ